MPEKQNALCLKLALDANQTAFLNPIIGVHYNGPRVNVPPDITCTLLPTPSQIISIDFYSSKFLLGSLTLSIGERRISKENHYY